MLNKLVDKLQFKLPPVAIYFTDEKPEDATQFKESTWGCSASMLISAAKGKTAVFDENTYGCAGGGLGLCFGDTYKKTKFPIDCLLSTGDEALKELGKTPKKSMGRGERFYETRQLAAEWRDGLPKVETGKKYVVFKPLREVDEANPPDLVFIFVNPDQLSALVIMSGFYRGKHLNVVAPFAASCQSIVLAYKEIGKEFPNAIMGFFDISQRHKISKELLSLTMPFSMYEEIEKSVDESCLTTEAWEKIEGRFSE